MMIILYVYPRIFMFLILCNFIRILTAYENSKFKKKSIICDELCLDEKKGGSVAFRDIRPS